MTNEQHNKYLGYAFLGHAAFQLLWMFVIAAFFLLFFSSFPGPPGEPGPPLAFFGLFFAFMVFFQLIFTLPSAIAGYALLKRKPWARMASIVGAIMSAMNVPIGTAVCVYALWFFMGEEWKEIYEPVAYRHSGHLPDAADPRWFNDQAEKAGEQTEKVPRPGDWR